MASGSEVFHVEYPSPYSKPGTSTHVIELPSVYRGQMGMHGVMRAHCEDEISSNVNVVKYSTAVERKINEARQVCCMQLPLNPCLRLYFLGSPSFGGEKNMVDLSVKHYSNFVKDITKYKIKSTEKFMFSNY